MWSSFRFNLFSREVGNFHIKYRRFLSIFHTFALSEYKKITIMIIDKLENIGMYASVNPLFAQAIEFLKSTDLNAHELGKVVLKEHPDSSHRY